MNSYLQYIEVEEGRKTIDLVDGFFAYSFEESTGELYISKIFINPESRGMVTKQRFIKEFYSLCKKTKAEYATAIVRLTPANKKSFLKKLNLFNRLGFEPQSISSDAVILVKELLC